MSMQNMPDEDESNPGPPSGGQVDPELQRLRAPKPKAKKVKPVKKSRGKALDMADAIAEHMQRQKRVGRL